MPKANTGKIKKKTKLPTVLPAGVEVTKLPY